MPVILTHPDILGGTPCFAGTRVPAETLLTYLSRGHALEHFLAQFPSVKREQAVMFLEMMGRHIPDVARQEAGRAAG